MSKYGVFSGLYFPVFGLNTEIYEVNIYFSPNTGKYVPEKTLYLDTFHAVHILFFVWLCWDSVYMESTFTAFLGGCFTALNEKSRHNVAVVCETAVYQTWFRCSVVIFRKSPKIELCSENYLMFSDL